MVRASLLSALIFKLTDEHQFAGALSMPMECINPIIHQRFCHHTPSQI